MSTRKTSMKIDQSTRQTLKGMVRGNETYSEVVKNRIKCDAAGCDAAGINEIKVKDWKVRHSNAIRLS